MAKLQESLAKLKEEFTGAWQLLNETTRYLKRAELFLEYEIMLKGWRELLQKRHNNSDTYKTIKKQIITLRKELRKEGHDLRLGNHDVKSVGFKSDDAPRYGFRRAVIYLNEDDIFYVTGEQNHIELIQILKQSFKQNRLENEMYIHNIWFRWNHYLLEIAGADSESKDQYQLMIDFIDEHKMFFLKSVKGMS